MKKREDIKRDIEAFDNKYGFGDFNYYYNKYKSNAIKNI